MKIGVISDTHDRLPTFRRAVSLFRRLEVGAIIHAGDYIAPFAAELLTGDLPMPVHGVLGNNDGERDGLLKTLPQLVDGPLRLEIADKTIVVHHFIDWLKPDEMAGADIVITGHTHRVEQEAVDGQLRLNPGECCGWVTDRCTVALLDLDTLEVEIVDVKA